MFFGVIKLLPSSFFDRNPVGRLMARLTSDVEALNEVFTSGLVMILADLVKLVGIVVILLWMDWRLALVTFAVLPPTLIATAYFRVRVRRAYREARHSRREISTNEASREEIRRRATRKLESFRAPTHDAPSDDTPQGD